MSDALIQVLLVEDSDQDARVLQGFLAENQALKFDVIRTRAFAEARGLLEHGHPDVLLLSLALAGSEELGDLDQARLIAPHLPIIVLSRVDDEALALRAAHEGAQDYLVKGRIDRPLLVRSIRYGRERKRSELSLLQLEEKFRGIVENTVEGIFQTSESGGYLSANPPLARIYGYLSPEELMRSLTDIAGQLYVDPGRRQEFMRLMQTHDVVTNFESRIYRKDRSIIWISENARAVRDRNGKLLYYEGTVQDITERKLAEEKLRNSEALYHSLVENLPQHIFRKDLRGRFTFANQRFCSGLGRPLEEILGKTDFDFYPPELAAKYQHDDREILDRGKTLEMVEEHRPPRGEKIYVNVVKSPLYNAQGRIIGLQGIFWDITARKRAEERAAQAHAQLARKQEELRLKNQQLEEDLVMAREIQQAILPQQYPSFRRGAGMGGATLRFCHRYLPTGAVGGDFFNILPLSESKAGVFICDVMGHGVRSALVTAIMRALVEELTLRAASPGDLLSQINRDLRAILKQSGSLTFTTAVYLVADLDAGAYCFSNAGHPKPFLIRRDSALIEPMRNSDGVSHPALGLFDAPQYPSYQLPMAPGDRVVLFTDGLYDVEGPQSPLVTLDWVRCELQKRLHQPTSALFDEILAEILRAAGQTSFADDVCLVGVEIA